MTVRNERRPGSVDKTVRDIRRATRRMFSADDFPGRTVFRAGPVLLAPAPKRAYPTGQTARTVHGQATALTGR